MGAPLRISHLVPWHLRNRLCYWYYCSLVEGLGTACKRFAFSHSSWEEPISFSVECCSTFSPRVTPWRGVGHGRLNPSWLPCGEQGLPSVSWAGVWGGSLGPCSALWSHRGWARTPSFHLTPAPGSDGSVPHGSKSASMPSHRGRPGQHSRANWSVPLMTGWETNAHAVLAASSARREAPYLKPGESQ